MQDLQHTVKWYVSLSNGETFFESKGDYKNLPDVKSPWQRLIDYTIDNNVDITSLGLYTDDGRRWNLTSSGNAPKFNAFSNAMKPIDYNIERSLSREMRRDGSVEVLEFYTVARAIYSTFELQIWVNNKNPDISYSYIKNLS